MTSEKAASYGLMNDNALVVALRDTWLSISDRREALGLSNPGSVENIAREVQKDVFLTNQMFTGLRGELTKPLSLSPLFQVSHAFSMGSQTIPPYGLSALYGTSKVFMQGNVDNDGSMSANFNYKWNNALVTKSSAQIASGPGQAMFTVNNVYTGKDFTASVNSINPSILDGGLTGIFIGTYLQSITPKLALGGEAMWQRAAVNAGPDTLISYCAKYKGSNWIASATMPAHLGAFNTSYWRRLTDKVEAGVDLNLQFTPGMTGRRLMGNGLSKEGTTTIGAKYDFRSAVMRAQVDSSGRLSCLLEKRVLGPVQVTFAGEMDHFKQEAKVGVAVSIEATSEEVMEQQERAGATAPNIPI